MPHCGAFQPLPYTSPRLSPVALDEAEIEFVEGYSRPGKLVEIEITARR
jgi:hypothetical protein